MQTDKKKKQYKSLLEDEDLFRALMEVGGNGDLFLDQMKRKHPEKEKDINDLQKIFKNLTIVERNLSVEEKQKLWSRIETERKKNIRIFRIKPLLKYASVIALLLISTFSLHFLWNRTPQATPVDYQSILSEIEAEKYLTENTLLVFPDGTKIEITDQQVEIAYDADGRLRINSSFLEEQSFPPNKSGKHNQLYVPYGKTAEMIMNDGTKVWVNSGSRLIFPPLFAADKREVYLEGEIYLEVAKKENSPFTVKTNRMEVEVLGTSFNVSAYKDDDVQSVVLASGSVAVKNDTQEQPTLIQPNQRYTLMKMTNEIKLDQVDVFHHVCWRDNLIMSDSESLAVILKKLERHYDVSIHYDANEINPIQVKGKLDLKNTIEQTLDVISMTTPVLYSVENKSIKLCVKPK